MDKHKDVQTTKALSTDISSQYQPNPKTYPKLLSHYFVFMTESYRVDSLDNIQAQMNLCDVMGPRHSFIISSVSLKFGAFYQYM